MSRTADLAVLSILWTLCSLPVITLGAASAALCRTTMNMVLERGDWNARGFFRYFRKNFRNATLLWLVFLLIAVILVADLFILSGNRAGFAFGLKLVAVLGLVLWTICAIWSFHLTVMFENTLRGTLKNALFLGISWLPRSLLMSAVWLLPVALAVFWSAVFSRIVILWPVLFWGASSYFCAKLIKKPISPYLEED